MNEQLKSEGAAEPKTFHAQYRPCRLESQVGFNEGPHHVMDPAFPSAKYRAFIAEHGDKPIFRLSTCKRFGGVCSSGHEQCRNMRGLSALTPPAESAKTP